MEVGILNPKKELDFLYLFIYEAFGTMILTTGIAMSNGYNLQPLTIIAVLYVAILLCGRISGAHFNMAVTIGIYVVYGKWKEHLKILVVYFLAEIFGTVMGLLVSHFLKNGDKEFILRPSDLSDSWLYILSVEFLFTTVFVSLIFHLKEPGLTITKDGAMGAWSVVFALYAAIGVTSNVTGACLNPNIGLSTVIFNNITEDDPDNIRYLPSYVIGPLLAGVAGGLLTRFAKRVQSRFDEIIKEREEKNLLAS